MRGWNYAMKNDFRMDAIRKAGMHGVTARQVGPLHLSSCESPGKKASTSSCTRSDEALQKCILIGFSDRVGGSTRHAALRTCPWPAGDTGEGKRRKESSLLVAAEIREAEGARAT